MTCPAPRRRTRSACRVLQTPVTWAPRCLAICTAKVPTPPEAPMIRTFWPGWIPPARSPCSAVTAASGTAAACSKVRFPGLGARPSWRIAMYSAKAPWPKPYTSSPGLNAVTALPGPLHRSSEVPARDRELRFADAPQSRRAEQERLAADEVPVPRIGRASTHRHQHVLRAGDRHLHLGQVQDILWRPVPVLDDRLHRVLPRGPCPRIPRR